MANTCYDTDLLQFSGTSQLQRALEALLAQYAKIDERTTGQLILFAKKYGAYLNYYDPSNLPAGDWQDFMSGDVSVTIAAIADWKAKELTPFIAEVNDEVHDAPNGDDAKKYFKTIFDLVFTLAFQLDASLKRLPEDVRFTNFLSVAITSNLAIPLKLLHNYYFAFRDAPLSLINETSDYIDPLMPVSPVLFSADFNPADLSKAWTTPTLTTPLITLQSIDVKEDISHVLTHNLFTGPLQLFVNGVINIVSKTPPYLEETLNNYPSHQPHYALYLAFLRLFRFAQEHLNGFTQNHLDFYYKDVLRLKNRNSEPGFVHLIFELQKSVEQYLLTKDTAFKAGKDANNNDLLYAITSDVVLQKATVQSLQSLYLDKGASAVLYASPVADSEDGSGSKLTSADNSWFTFGDPEKIAGASIGFAVASNVLFLNEGVRVVTFTFNCNTTIGISESALVNLFIIRFTGKKDWHTATSYTAKISGSSFTLTVTLTGDVPPIVPYSQKIHNEKFDTTLPVAQAQLKSYQSYQAIKSIQVNSLTIGVTATVKNLSLQSKDGKINAAKPFKPFGDFPEINSSFIIGSEEIFQKHLTELRIEIDWQPTDSTLIAAIAQKDFKDMFIDSIQAETAASSTVSLANNVSKALDNTEENFPDTIATRTAKANFGAFDVQSDSAMGLNTNSLQIENIAEAFGLSNISAASLELADVYTEAQVVNKLAAPADVIVLTAGEWSASATATSSDIRSADITLNSEKSGAIPVAETSFDGNEDYDINAVSGFIKLRLKTSNYSLGTYLTNTQKALQQTSVSVEYYDDAKTQVKSYTVPAPKIATPAPHLTANGISIAYSAQSVINFTTDTETSFANSTAFYYHTEPSGLRIMHPFLTDDAITFLPVFNLDNGDAKGTGGELWIGLKDAFADETLTILFQVSDGTSNPLKKMTEVSWHYLASNNWLPFDAPTIVDETNNLTRSGIVTVTLPKNITTGNTRADETLTWIKLVVDQNTDALCKLIAVRTNSAKAYFVQDLTKGIEYTSALLGSTISKPATPIASVKKTEQPYTSFGGRLRETDSGFYIRVSERLRHKHRAVAAWDYERLVLDYFPQIHKTKCINHTGFIRGENTGETKYSEVLPGHVMVVTVPDLKGRLSANLLRPYTSQGLLEEIQQYLEKLTSPFVKLLVVNPQFEEVQFDFEVTFLPNYDITLYKKMLIDEIEQFLSPWAYESGRDIEFGGKIEKSVVLNFVEERSYVDFVTCFKMHQFIRDENNVIVKTFSNIEEAVASTARSILVSYCDDSGDIVIKHLIHSPANCNCNG